jgi:glycosyltransferase involved in cell wall biosynthesis
VKVTYFTKYSAAGPSSRYRSYQYFPALEASELNVEVKPLLNDLYLSQKFSSGRVDLWQVLSAFCKRIWGVLSLPSGSIVVIEYELLPWFPAVLERWLVWRGCRYLVDFDDAIFHQYDTHSSLWVRALLGRKIALVMRLAQTVVAGNAYLAAYAHASGAKRVEVIPTVIDLRRYPLRTLPSGQRPVIIGWIGSPSTSRYLLQVASALAQVCADGQAKVCLVGAASIDLPGVPVERITWNESTEIAALQSFDVGIMPLPDEPWARGKCGFKLIQYMACGLPVVASPVGINTEIVEDGGNGYLASTTEEWVIAIKRLCCDAELRQHMGAAGRKRVEEKYCLSVTAPKMIELFKKCAA